MSDLFLWDYAEPVEIDVSPASQVADAFVSPRLTVASSGRVDGMRPWSGLRRGSSCGQGSRLGGSCPCARMGA